MVESEVCQHNLMLFLNHFPSCHLSVDYQLPTWRQKLLHIIRPHFQIIYVFIAQMCNLQLVSKTRQFHKCTISATTPFLGGLFIFHQVFGKWRKNITSEPIDFRNFNDCIKQAYPKLVA